MTDKEILNSNVVTVYIHATGSKVHIYDGNFNIINQRNEYNLETNICQYCTQINACRGMHINSIRKTISNGKPYIYQCEAGLWFWVCPIYHESVFSAALRGSGYLNNKEDISVRESIYNNGCKEFVSKEEFLQRISSFPEANMEKIESLAEILLLCAKSLSSGSENLHEELRFKHDQQIAISLQIEKLNEKYPIGSPMPDYPIEKEQWLVSSMREGKKEESQNYLNEILSTMIFINKHNFRHIQLRVLELAVLLIRAGKNIFIDNNNDSIIYYMNLIQEAKTQEELISILHNIVDKNIDQIVSYQGIPHALAIRRADVYIRENLTKKLALSKIAKIAGLTAPYFSTVFKSEMGENMSKYINRLRVEKASEMLLETYLSISEIAEICCFGDQSWFSKIFKSFTGISPGKYRNQNRKNSKNIVVL